MGLSGLWKTLPADLVHRMEFELVTEQIHTEYLSWTPAENAGIFYLFKPASGSGPEVGRDGPHE